LERDVTDMVNEVSFSSFNLDLSFIFHSIFWIMSIDNVYFVS
jgi:hypothetical protein